MMNFTVDFPIRPLPTPITYPNSILLIGSCFTEHIGNRLAQAKFAICQNPHGILFNPISVCRCLKDITSNQVYTTDDVFYMNETWQSWYHHSRFNGHTAEESVSKINTSIAQAHHFAMQANWLIVTLGSAFAYRLNDRDMHVSNNHRAPSQWLEKELLEIDFMVNNLVADIEKLKEKNAKLQILFTISPVRHLRDGLIENNHSKARLIECVQQLCTQLPYAFYFPAYEIVIDQLRDYRFYDIDLAHPNFMATEFVWQRFIETCIAQNDVPLLQQLKQINIAKNHRPVNSQSNAHQQFLQSHLAKCISLEKEFPWLDFGEEKESFGGNY